MDLAREKETTVVDIGKVKAGVACIKKTQTVEENKDNRELIKHSSAIHCSNSLSLLQRKISNILLYHAYPNLSDIDEHKLSIKEICYCLNYKGHNYDVIKEATRVLVSSLIEWNLTDEKTGEEDWTASSILASVNIKGSVLTYAYSPRMKKLLYSPTMYGKINLIIQSRFTSSYALALYENCVRYRNLKQTKELPIDVFRKIMGIAEGKYLIFRDFKRRVLDKAVEEINALSDIIVEPVIKRVGRKVTSIYFKLKGRAKKKKFISHVLNKQQDKQKERVSIGEEQLIDQLRDRYGISQQESLKLIDKYGQEKIDEKIVQIESSPSFLSGAIKNLAGYLIDALNKDYQPVVSSKERALSLKREEEQKKWLEKKKKEKQEELKYKYDKYVSSKIDEVIFNEEKMKSESMQKILNNWLKSCDSITSGAYRKRGLSDVFVKSSFRCYIKKEYSLLLPTLQSFDEYVASLDS